MLPAGVLKIDDDDGDDKRKKQVCTNRKWTKRSDIVCKAGMKQCQEMSWMEIWMPFQGGRNMICRPKQIQASPNLMELSVGAGIEIPIEMKYGNQSKQIRFNISPNLMVWVSHPPAFLDVSRHFVKKKTPRNPSRSEFRCMGELIYQKTPLSSTYHWFEAHWKFRITVRGVAAAVSLFGDDFYCICFDHPNRETAMLSS